MSGPTIQLAGGSGRRIGGHHPCLIVAEIGQNHQGDVDIAKRMIDMAKRCGADCVKLQKSSLPDKFAGSALRRPYEGPHSWGATYGEHKAHLELSRSAYRELQEYAKQAGTRAASLVDILFTASAMDPVSAEFLEELDVPFVKVGSGDADNLPMISEIAGRGRPVVVSTGMQSLETVRRVYELVLRHTSQLALLQCTSAYPTPDEHVHLRVLQQYQQAFPRTVIGYSGHEQGTAITVAAVALGAKIVERHVTLDHSWRGSDHACSLEPAQLTALVSDIRRLELALGTPAKAVQPSEHACWLKLGKTVVARRELAAGCRLTAADLAVKVAEPKGWRPERLNQLVGRRLRTALQADDSVTDDVLEPEPERE
ncbi:Sialic acid synthase [Amphibalanus amphitrite]|uniref:N-acetylneuraminate-9-phosphate synthase n=1 Tax=Amphibalanus amphitrite TaxID=1232801 RepID=A0A6A4WUT1_AMPAM|nr:Sialic acid synthase [Amphibalanus amphitrite]